ncbi:hypothetical protein BDV06DRAFT_209333 [Aspergillus oleicola]
MGLPTPTSTSSEDHSYLHDNDDDQDRDDEDDMLARIQTKLEHLWSLYNAGKLLFPRTLLADLDRQIDSGNKDVTIEDLDGVNHNYSLQIPGWCKDFATTYRIGYSCIQDLTCVHPSFPEISLRDNSPVSICYTSCTDYHPESSLDEVEAKFAESQSAWEESETYQSLVRNLEKLKRSGKLTKPVRKIVGFGLGSLSCLADEFHCMRAHAQHAAIRTMVRALSSKEKKGGVHPNGTGHTNGYPNRHSDINTDRDAPNRPSTNTSKGYSTRMTPDIENERPNSNSDPESDFTEIKCYAQDPAYTEADTVLLRSLGISTLDDPKGLLEIDDETLVFSVSPNVPVKQIVADVAWPGVMIWNTVALEEKEAQWEKKVRDGEEYWVVPFTTDPDSQRVRDMVSHYTSVPLKDSDEYFGDLTIYVR